MKNPSFATRWNIDVIDSLYQDWLDDPNSVDTRWRDFFEGFELARSSDGAAPSGKDEFDRNSAIKQARFTGAIYAYRSIGHTQADINPLVPPVANPRLTLERLGFSEEMLDEVYETGNYLGGIQMSVKDLLGKLERTYCGPVGVEYLHIQDTAQRRWLQAKMEPSENAPKFSAEKKKRLLAKILQAELFERFLHTKYVGQKRFSLEGGETIIAALDTAIEKSPDVGIEEIVMGMAHRGRLNVLANVFGKTYEFIFHEFSENYIPDTPFGDGDVKYHLGFDSEIDTTSGEKVEIRLAANPSHLEAVNPIVEGRARARQRIRSDFERKKVLPVLLHGDAAFAGQGIVSECLNLSQLKGYTTGGTLHYIINNQIGFTTDPSEARSSRYCTDVAKMIEAPIFHVNGDDPDAVAYVTEIALEYRQQFGKDVVIDMYCYRRHGHNESDEPAFTQPILYKKISEHPLISETYSKRLLETGAITEKDIKKLQDDFTNQLEEAFDKKKSQEEEQNRKHKEKQEELASSLKQYLGSNQVFQPKYNFDPGATEVNYEALEKVAKCLTTFPDGFKVNPKIERQLKTKWKAFQEDGGIDWAFAEQLAWGTLMLEGAPIRLSGQDSERGTFSQRHAAFYDVETRTRYMPLMNLPDNKSMICVHNSSLSEAAVLGFDYGYSLDYPQMLCMWEAQFGDFVNGAQTIIDQFITCSESKWQRVSGIVLLLPHGYEGQGPEHSSARLERFLQACAEDNIQVCNLTTPAQYFHVLRRQVKRDFRKPLVIMAPKWLLRAKEATSPLADFTDNTFHTVLDDPESPKSAERVILCSGKVYYDLQKYRTEKEIKNTAIVRIEQLYPFHQKALAQVLERYKGYKKLVWCQEESRNMGSWSFIAPLLEQATGMKPRYAGRVPSASPAVGSLAMHRAEQSALIESAFNV